MLSPTNNHSSITQTTQPNNLQSPENKKQTNPNLPLLNIAKRSDLWSNQPPKEPSFLWCSKP
uniref:Uncharacterized protein n=1 Tax=Arundo donax TaxID=35708 RepID=A0A0A9A293_ARUDO